MNSVKVNGKEYHGNNICVIGNNIIVDGALIEDLCDSVVNVEISGDAGSIDCNGSVTVHGNSESIDCGGSANVGGNVNGDIDCGGSCNVTGDVNGDIDAGGSVIFK